MFYDILEGRKDFLDYKNRKLKKSKNWMFLKGLVHGFGQKLVIFPQSFFFFWKIGQKSNFYVIVEWRNAFLDYKKNSLKKSRNWDFSKGISPSFWSKTGNFSRFLF